jgi:hypothetical protein
MSVNILRSDQPISFCVEHSTVEGGLSCIRACTDLEWIGIHDECARRAHACVTVKARRLVNPNIYHSEVVKVLKRIVNASISGFYQTILVNDSIYQHQFVKARSD